MSIKVEPFVVGNFVHAYNSGNKKAPIFFDKSDRWHFMRALKFFNEERDITEFAQCSGALIRSKKDLLKGLDPFSGRNTFEWQEEWGQQRPLVEIVSFLFGAKSLSLVIKRNYSRRH